MEQSQNAGGQHDAHQIIVREENGSLVCSGGHDHVVGAQMNQPLRRAGVRIALQNSQQIAFVQTEAIAVLQNLECSWRIAAAQ